MALLNSRVNSNRKAAVVKEITEEEKKYGRYMRELEDFCEESWGVESRCVRLIAASLLNPAPLVPCWLIVESSRHSFWDDLCQALNRMSLRPMLSATRMRTTRPRWANNSYEMEMMERKLMPRLVLDYEWDNPQIRMHYRNRWDEYQAEFLRLKVNLPACRLANHAAEYTLFRLLQNVVNTEHRPFLPGYWQLPEYLITHLNLLMKLNGDLKDGSRLTTNFSILGSGLAVAQGRRELNQQDHLDMYAVLLNQIRPWTRKILKALVEGKSCTINDIHVMSGLSAKLRPVIVQELTRLAENGVVVWKTAGMRGRPHKYMRLSADYGPDVELLLKMEARWWE